jgi:hypothetical protein
MKRILFPNDENYLLAFTGISNSNSQASPKEIDFSSRISQFTNHGSFSKYTPSFSEIEGLMEYKQKPNQESGWKEVQHIESLLKLARLKKIKNASKRNSRVWIAASSILLIVVLTALIHRIKTNEIDAIYNFAFTVPSSGFILTKAELPYTLEWDKSILAYNQRDFKNAIASFNLIPQESQHSEYASFFKGICFMSEEQFPQALAIFESIEPTSEVYLYAKWHAGLCNLKLNRINDARVIFSELSVSKELEKNASEILQKLERID